MGNLRRWAGGGLAVVYAFTQVTSSVAEGSLWEARRAAQRDGGLPVSAVAAAFSSPGTALRGRATVAPGPPGRPGAPVVYLVHDVHGDDTTQANIGGALVALAVEEGVGLVGLEGAAGPLLTDAFRGAPAGALAQVAGALRRSGRLSGPEWAALTDRRVPPFVGVEDPVLYRAHRRAAEEGFSHRAVSDAVRRSLAQRVETLKRQTYGPALALFDARRARHAQGQMPSLDYVRVLSAGLGPAAPPAPQLRRFLRWAEGEGDAARAAGERRRLLRAVVDRLSPAARRELLARADASRTGALAPEDFAAGLRRLAGRCGVPPAAAAPSVAPALDRARWWRELASWERAAELRLARTPGERRVVDLARDAALVDDVLVDALTPDGWADYGRRRGGVLTLPGRAGLSALAGGWEELLRPHEAFCRWAEARNAALLSGLERAMTTRGVRRAALVVGGFHAPGLAREIARRGWSWVEVTPRVGAAAGGPVDALFRPPTPLESRLARRGAFLAPERPLAEPMTEAAAPRSRATRLALILGTLALGGQEPTGWAKGVLPPGFQAKAEPGRARLRAPGGPDLIAAVNDPSRPALDRLPLGDGRVLTISEDGDPGARPPLPTVRLVPSPPGVSTFRTFAIVDQKSGIPVGHMMVTENDNRVTLHAIRVGGQEYGVGWENRGYAAAALRELGLNALAGGRWPRVLVVSRIANPRLWRALKAALPEGEWSWRVKRPLGELPTLLAAPRLGAAARGARAVRRAVGFIHRRPLAAGLAAVAAVVAAELFRRFGVDPWVMGVPLGIGVSEIRRNPMFNFVLQLPLGKTKTPDRVLAFLQRGAEKRFVGHVDVKSTPGLIRVRNWTLIPPPGGEIDWQTLVQEFTRVLARNLMADMRRPTPVLFRVNSEGLWQALLRGIDPARAFVRHSGRWVPLRIFRGGVDGAVDLWAYLRPFTGRLPIVVPAPTGLSGASVPMTIRRMPVDPMVPCLVLDGEGNARGLVHVGDVDGEAVLLPGAGGWAPSLSVGRQRMEGFVQVFVGRRIEDFLKVLEQMDANSLALQPASRVSLARLLGVNPWAPGAGAQGLVIPPPQDLWAYLRSVRAGVDGTLPQPMVMRGRFLPPTTGERLHLKVARGFPSLRWCAVQYADNPLNVITVILGRAGNGDGVIVFPKTVEAHDQRRVIDRLEQAFRGAPVRAYGVDPSVLRELVGRMDAPEVINPVWELQQGDLRTGKIPLSGEPSIAAQPGPGRAAADSPEWVVRGRFKSRGTAQDGGAGVAVLTAVAAVVAAGLWAWHGGWGDALAALAGAAGPAAAVFGVPGFFGALGSRGKPRPLVSLVPVKIERQGEKSVITFRAMSPNGRGQEENIGSVRAVVGLSVVEVDNPLIDRLPDGLQGRNTEDYRQGLIASLVQNYQRSGKTVVFRGVKDHALWDALMIVLDQSRLRIWVDGASWGFGQWPPQQGGAGTLKTPASWKSAFQVAISGPLYVGDVPQSVPPPAVTPAFLRPTTDPVLMALNTPALTAYRVVTKNGPFPGVVYLGDVRRARGAVAGEVVVQNDGVPLPYLVHALAERTTGRKRPPFYEISVLEQAALEALRTLLLPSATLLPAGVRDLALAFKQFPWKRPEAFGLVLPAPVSVALCRFVNAGAPDLPLRRGPDGMWEIPRRLGGELFVPLVVRGALSAGLMENPGDYQLEKAPLPVLRPYALLWKDIPSALLFYMGNDRHGWFIRFSNTIGHLEGADALPHMLKLIRERIKNANFQFYIGKNLLWLEALRRALAAEKDRVVKVLPLTDELAARADGRDASAEAVPLGDLSKGFRWKAGGQLTVPLVAWVVRTGQAGRTTLAFLSVLAALAAGALAVPLAGPWGVTLATGGLAPVLVLTVGVLAWGWGRLVGRARSIPPGGRAGALVPPAAPLDLASALGGLAAVDPNT